MNYDAILVAKILVQRQNARTCPPVREDELPIRTHWTERTRASVGNALVRLAMWIAPPPSRLGRPWPTGPDIDGPRLGQPQG